MRSPRPRECHTHLTYASWLWFSTTFGYLITGCQSVRCGGSTRRKHAKMEKKDVDERYSYPNLYVSGGTKHANAFNCAQRSHQQQLETVAAFTMFALTAALSFPVVATVASIIYTISRRIWAKGYGSNNDEGDAQRRYSAFFSGFFWKALATLGFMSFMVCANLTGLLHFGKQKDCPV